MLPRTIGLRFALLAISLLLPVTAIPARAESDAAGKPSNGGGAFSWVQRLARFHAPDEHERNHPAVRSAFSEIVRPASQCTVRVLCDGVQRALGTIVRADGYIVSKASELSGSLECWLHDGRRLKATLLAVDADTDIAMLKVDAQNLPTVEWSRTETVRVGSWLATTSPEATPAAIGVVSTPPRPIPKPRAVLGVRLEDSPQGPRIEHILPGSPAARAGLRTGDVVVRVDGQETRERDALTEAISRRQPGERVVLSVIRDQQPLSITATLEDVARLGNEQQAALMDSLGGPLSKRRSGFPAVLQHDSVLRPRDCGGPVVDLEGKVVGINIARASRVASYALPASVLRRRLPELWGEKLTPVAREESRQPSVAGR